MRRLLALLMTLCCLLPLLAHAEEAELTLLTADTVEEVNQFILLPTAEEVPALTRGSIRYITLNEKDGAFRADFWQNETYDLTVKTGKNGETYRADHRNMHSRAVYCMALSYLGVEMTPVMMSELAESRDVSAPFDAVTAQLPNVERVEVTAYIFDTMVENYLNDPSYSPVYCQIRKPNGELYTVLIVGYIPEKGGFIICDAAALQKDGERLHAYEMDWHVMREVVLYSDFYDAFYASQVVAVYQWHLVEE